MRFRIGSIRALFWILVHWGLFLFWATAGFVVAISFVASLIGINEITEQNLPLSALLAATIIPLSLYFGRRFAIDSARYSRRFVTIEDSELRITDPIWLEGEHAIPLSAIAMARRTTPEERLSARDPDERVLDLSCRAPLRYQVVMEFSVSVTFERRPGPMIFDMILTFIDPGEGDAVRRLIIESPKPSAFLDALALEEVRVSNGSAEPAVPV